MRRRVSYVSHPEVTIDPALPVPDWRLSPQGRARAAALGASGWCRGPVRLIASPERKAQETAALLAGVAAFETHPEMAEIDRSATGYVPRERHEALADALLARPDESAAGWETARAAQARILAAYRQIASWPGDTSAHLILVGHGGVGTLLWCALTGRPIARAEDQPGGGHVWAFDPGRGRAIHPWRRFEDLGPTRP
ncbi:phosphoglycerate mutase [Defluviimonas sp. 20V17]|uniref:Broad specificity phosphatase PhoE n=1 Tax=Allgaiera indica TaxID=765699 RepID=A0AAN4UP15_9RHOB|nr:histidine phosphatase family protein [Allgaiera indica]KDB04564.1 phosphoglycerate mutase [Defluviimonas sp. 20V17]GHD99667.1 phosphoglycerate mutase [Allgaiera indica]SDW20828.1 Broad specificity phosphatase PhoE [Allgaiera indica]